MNSELTKLIEEALGGGRGTTGLVLILLSWIAGIFGAFLGSYFNAELQKDVYYKTEILLPRLEAYKTLWNLTYGVRPTRQERITEEEKSKLNNELTAWYYECGNGIFLSLKTGKLWRSARRSLSNQSDDQIQNEFSSLRTQLKRDIKVYGKQAARIELGT
jgi:hypothetical protein